MNKKETNISQISSYLKGELDGKAMHHLEKLAQDDPFLMDALEGYESSKSDQQTQLAELTKRIHQRISKHDRKIVFMKFSAIAASVLIVISICGRWFYTVHYADKAKLVENIKPVIKSLPATPEPLTTNNKPDVAAIKPILHFNKSKKQTPSQNNTVASIIPSPVASEKAATGDLADKLFNSSADSSTQDTTPLTEMIVMGYTNKKKDVIKETATVADVENTKKRDTVAQQLLQGRVKGVAANNVNAPRPQLATELALANPGAKPLKEITILHKDYSTLKRTIKGQIVASDDGLPIIGVTVKVAGTNTETQTDINGYFNLPRIGNHEKLVVARLGYQTVDVNAHNTDSLKTIVLKPESNLLSEVVVSGYSSSKNTTDAINTAAHPKDGWNGFRKYLKKNAVSPDGKNGIVKTIF